MLIEHDPNERRPKASLVAIITAAIAIALGLGLTRGLKQGFTASEALWLGLIGVSAALAFFVAIHVLLKGWDRAWSRLKATWKA